MDEPSHHVCVDLRDLQAESKALQMIVRDLQAESRALQMIVAFLLVHNVAALELLEQLEPMIGDLAEQESLSDRQIAVLRSTLSKMVINVRRCRDSLPPTQ